MNRVANDGSTPLSKAAMNGNDGVARALCEAGADPNIQGGKKQWTALHYAARRSQLPSLEVIPPIGAEGLDRSGPAGSRRLFLGPGFQLGARWNRLGETVKTRKKREKTGGKWARYGLRSVNQGS